MRRRAGTCMAPHMAARCTTHAANMPPALLLPLAVQDDNSVVTLHPKTMETLELFRGDTVLLKVRPCTVLACTGLFAQSRCLRLCARMWSPQAARGPLLQGLVPA